MGNFRFAMATKSSTTTRIFAITNVLSPFICIPHLCHKGLVEPCTVVIRFGS